MPDALRRPAELCARDGRAELCEAVVPPAFILGARAPFRHFGDQPLLHHSRDGSVERAGAHAQLAIRARFDIMDDGVPVAFAVREGEQDVQGCQRERQEFFCGRFAAHDGKL